MQMAKNKKLDLNPKKCKILIFKKNKPFDPIDLLINNTKIPTFKCLKDLGIYIYICIKIKNGMNT